MSPNREPASYVPLKCQTDHSVLRSCVKIDDLVACAAERAHGYLAICDLNNVSGYYDFYVKCRKNGIKPIIGAAIDVRDEITASGEKKELSHRITLYCKNYAGLLNLFKIINSINLSAGRTPVSSETVFKYQQGLICAFSNVSSAVYKLNSMKFPGESDRFLKRYIENFGAGRLYFELWKDSVAHEDDANLLFLELAKKYDIKPVAVNNCQYLAPCDRLKGFAAIYALRNEMDFDTACAKLSGTGNFHFKSSQEMSEAFAHIQSALENARDLAFRCNVEIPREGFLIPQYPAAEGFTQHGYLSFLTRNRLSVLKDINYELYEHRLNIELDIIEKLDFSSYFLIVWDLVNYARQNSIPVGPGRGSACSSLVCYLLGITKIDPIEYQLTFERFLNPGRVKMPDIDIDFASSERYRIIEYAASKYGKDRVSQIITFSHFKHKALFNSLVKILRFPDNLIKNIAPVFNRSVADNPDITFEGIFLNSILNKFYNAESRVRDLCEIARSLLNNIKQVSIHAGGIVISPTGLFDNLPLSKPNGEMNVTAVEMNVLNELGYLKIDLLGINALEKIEQIRDAIQKYRGVSIDIEKIPLDDKKTFELISSGETYGIFQLETQLFRKFLPQLKPGCIKELAAAIALIRPGPIQANVLTDYALRKSGRAKIEYPLESMTPILKETYGLIVFQEQIMRIATDVFDYSYSEADIFREIMSKKAEDKIELERENFLQRARIKKIDARKAVEIFNLISKFARYCFNKAHSAAYSRVAYYMAYFMANYPLEYMVSLLNNDIRDRGPDYGVKINFLKRNRIAVYGVDINSSGLYHGIETRSGAPAMVHGLSSVALVSVNAASEIIAERDRNGPFVGINDFIARVVEAGGRVKITDLEPLVRCGAFDSIAAGMSRERILADFKNSAFTRKRVNDKNEAAGQINFLKPFSGAANRGIGERKFMPQAPAGEKSAFFLDDERSCILKHIKRISISDYSRSAGDSAQCEPAGQTVKSYGEIYNYNPLIAELELKDPFDVIGEYVIKLFVPQELLKKINSLAKGDIVFFEFEICEKRQAMDFSAAAGPAGGENILVLKEIAPYIEASYSFSAYIKAEENALAPEGLVLIKRLTERYEGSIPLFIKIGELTIATNKKINFSEKFIREIRSIEKLSAGIDFYIELK
ncbi:MAG TPA: DNA polymerase III subunit alpha [Candidatus Wallbacteria bacterium]|nr:DNA polymerase III subunit alpha [Candidatus Wallbacteria bacterium]